MILEDSNNKAKQYFLKEIQTLNKLLQMAYCFMQVFASVAICLVCCSSCLPCNRPSTDTSDTTNCNEEYSPTLPVFQLQHGIEAAVTFTVSCPIYMCMYGCLHIVCFSIKMVLSACSYCESAHRYLVLFICTTEIWNPGSSR